MTTNTFPQSMPVNNVQLVPSMQPMLQQHHQQPMGQLPPPQYAQTVVPQQQNFVLPQQQQQQQQPTMQSMMQQPMMQQPMMQPMQQPMMQQPMMAPQIAQPLVPTTGTGSADPQIAPTLQQQWAPSAEIIMISDGSAPGQPVQAPQLVPKPNEFATCGSEAVQMVPQRLTNSPQSNTNSLQSGPSSPHVLIQQPPQIANLSGFSNATHDNNHAPASNNSSKMYMTPPMRVEELQHFHPTSTLNAQNTGNISLLTGNSLSDSIELGQQHMLTMAPALPPYQGVPTVSPPGTNVPHAQQRPGNHRERDTNLMVRFLPSYMRADDLEKLFSCIGRIAETKVIADTKTGEWQSKGYGFVKFFRQQDAVEALNRFNGFSVALTAQATAKDFGRQLEVKVANPSGDIIKGPDGVYMLRNQATL